MKNSLPVIAVQVVLAVVCLVVNGTALRLILRKRKEFALMQRYVIILQVVMVGIYCLSTYSFFGMWVARASLNSTPAPTTQCKKFTVWIVPLACAMNFLVVLLVLFVVTLQKAGEVHANNLLFWIFLGSALLLFISWTSFFIAWTLCSFLTMQDQIEGDARSSSRLHDIKQQLYESIAMAIVMLMAFSLDALCLFVPVIQVPVDVLNCLSILLIVVHNIALLRRNPVYRVAIGQIIPDLGCSCFSNRTPGATQYQGVPPV